MTNGPKVTILYGSQTGTAQDVARRISKDLLRRHVPSTVRSLDDYEVLNLQQERFLIFCASTSGRGEVPDNMRAFWTTLLNKKFSSPEFLQGVQFAVFGLGDSSYASFNFVAKRLFNRLQNIGGTPIVPRGDGDDQAALGLESALIPWLAELYRHLLMAFPLYGRSIIPDDVLLPPILKVRASQESLPSDIDPLIARSTNPDDHFSFRKPFPARIIENCRLTATDWHQDVRHIVFDITGSNLSFRPGDAVNIIARNSDSDACAFLTFMGFDPNMVIEIDGETDLPSRSRLVDLMKDHFEIMGTGRTSFFEAISHFASDAMQKDKLREYCTPEGQSQVGVSLRFLTKDSRWKNSS
eukprot:TRINITY_DN2826_c1_g1_i3.p1 TRINITY_DN2826_c1_g1~~TRINITY_DN2826_c1_g1_i3.p1  ORF type:complete len:354 (-),score=68.08 TRINITY_DN2826_c1_g1_i3:801-1862(-)